MSQNCREICSSISMQWSDLYYMSQSEYRTVLVLFRWLTSKSIRLVDSNAFALCLEISEVSYAGLFVAVSLLHSKFDQNIPTTWQFELISFPFISLAPVPVEVLAFNCTRWFCLMYWDNYDWLPFLPHRFAVCLRCPPSQNFIGDLLTNKVNSMLTIKLHMFVFAEF